MSNKMVMTIVATGGLLLSGVVVTAQEGAATRQDIAVSSELRALLRAEMREIASGMQSMTLALAGADWQVIKTTSDKIRASYILEQKLTAAQRQELERKLPEQFKQLDAAFHQRAEKLAVAAAAHDAELTLFHYTRLMESCTACHTAYAKSRFPAFSPPEPDAHHH